MLSKTQFVETVAAFTGCEIVTLVWEKACKMRKAFDGSPVTKRTEMQGRIGAEYVNSVNNRVEAETGHKGEFVPLSLPWGEWAVYPRTITHKGEDYVRLTRWEADADNLKPSVTVWGYEGREYARFEDLPAEARAGMRADDKPSAPSKNPRQSEAGAEEVQVKCFTVNADNVRVLRASGEEFQVG